MSETRETKLGPFHETVQMTLLQATAGCQADPYKQGGLAYLLGLIYKTKVPPEALAQLIETCTTVRSTIHEAMRQTSLHLPDRKKHLGYIAGIAEATVEDLRLRLEQKETEGQEALATASGDTE